MKSPALRFARKNWKSLLIAFLVFGVLLNIFVLKMMKSSPAYQKSLSVVINDSRVKKLIGTPIEEGVFVTGNVSTHTARISYSLKGPKGEGDVFVYAQKAGVDRWEFETLEFGSENKVINFLKN